jgi:hypothetical protein
LRTETTLLDKISGEIVPATLVHGVSKDVVDGTEALWEKPRLEGALRLKNLGVSVPEHYHWDWKHKSSRLRSREYVCFGIECRGKMQGLMMVNTKDNFARLAPDMNKPVVYIDYLESAPWNLNGFVDEPHFGAVGARLFEAAVRYSIAKGFEGRVGLHALPQSEAFYARTCCMTQVGRDAAFQDLSWYEITARQATWFLTEGQAP